jgi:hypothetical protein
MAIRRYEGRMIGTAARISRHVIATFALVTLAGCAGGSSSSDLSPTAPEPQIAAVPLAAAPPPPPQSAAPPPAGRPAQAAPAAPPPPAKQAALTPEEAKGKCWMRYENDRRAKSIDERLKLVEKCVDDTLRSQPPPPPAR